VLHLSIHSFTPHWKGRRRKVDVGVLFDPARRHERAFTSEWLAALHACRADLCLRRNLPYRGYTDGLTTHLRTRFADSRYLGVELEVSQRFPLGPAPAWRSLRRDIAATLTTVVGAGPP
jgi:predicted N-formylglutamate amidohydrolase